MAQSGRPTMTKRQREAKRATRRQNKEAKKAQRSAAKQERAGSAETHPSVDPDIADIVPGPQPPRY